MVEVAVAPTATLPKFTLVGVTERPCVATIPFPTRGIVRGGTLPLNCNVSSPAKVPVFAGEKKMLNVIEPFIGIL